MTGLAKLWENRGFRRFLIFLILALALFALKSMINFILLTFIFTFLMDRVQTFVTKWVHKWVPISQKLIVLILYVLLVTGLIVGGFRFYPVIKTQVEELVKQIKSFYLNPEDIPFFSFISNTFDSVNLNTYIEQGFNFLYKYLTDLSILSVQIFLSLILSMFFLLEKQRLIMFSKKFQQSKLSAFYTEIAFFGRKFVRTFGKVIEAQFIIALVNCVLTTIGLWFFDFPQLFGLAILIFFLGLIPVAGVILSLIPLSIIGYTIGGFTMILYLLIMIMIIHAIEAYLLNPKLMSAKTELPVFFTFIVLIFSEHFFGVWGLIVGIPVFVFLLDVLGVTNNKEEKA